jgi:hypothetical protein
MELSMEEKAARLHMVMFEVGSHDQIQCQSILEATNYDVEACLQMFRDSAQAAASLQPIPILVKFEEQTYKLALPGTSALADIKRALAAASSIAEREQILVEEATQTEPPIAAPLSIYPRVGDTVILHLLTPNSAV